MLFLIVLKCSLISGKWTPPTLRTTAVVYRLTQHRVCDTAKCGIDLIPSKYRASFANTNTDTFYLEKQFIYFRVGESNAS